MTKHDETFWKLVTLRLSGEANQGELQLLERWIRSHPDLATQFELIEQWWNDRPPGNEAAFSSFFKKIVEHIEATERTGPATNGYKLNPENNSD